jgi:hypothetical protein
LQYTSFAITINSTNRPYNPEGGFNDDKGMSYLSDKD